MLIGCGRAAQLPGLFVSKTVMTPATLGTRRRLIAAEGPQGRARGFILIVVIWLVALLALMSGAFVRSVQGHVRSSAVHSQLARAETIADSGFALAVLDLAESRAAPGRERRFPVNGKAVTCQLGGSDRITVRVKDAGGLINLNTAGERLLQAFFIGLGASREIASRRADLLLDFRDADHDRRLNGAERPEYRATGRSYGPKNAPLDSLDELSQILEFDAELIEQVLPYVTIHSGTAGLDPAVVSHALADIVNRGVDALPATVTCRSSSWSRRHGASTT